jgi:hypothetical protein
MLKVVTTISTEVEAVLQAAAYSGTMSQKGQLGDSLRRLWSAYDTAITSPCVTPELQTLQDKNHHRRGEHFGSEVLSVVLPNQAPQQHTLHANPSADSSFSQKDPEQDRATLSSDSRTYMQLSSQSMIAICVYIMQLVKEKQAAEYAAQNQEIRVRLTHDIDTKMSCSAAHLP